MSRFISTDLKSESESDFKEEPESVTELMAKLESDSE